MKPITALTILLASLGFSAPAMAGASADSEVPAYLTKAMASPARDQDKADDARRQMAAVMQFAGVKPGQDVLELVPGRGYWTLVFSGVVGTAGHVYTVWPDEMAKFSGKGFARIEQQSKQPGFSNISLLKEPAAKLSVPQPVDLVFTCQNYHDYHDPFMGPVDMTAFNKEVFNTLKPGGVYVIIDHVAPAGSGLKDTNTLHRIDPAAVKKEVEAAGFEFDGESDALRNPDDPHDIKVFDKSIRGHTDQFIYRFRKPAG